MSVLTQRLEKAENQIIERQKKVDYDIKEYPIEVLVSKYKTKLEDDDNELFIPSYQREFVWKKDRQSKFIESILMGLPIPYIFAAITEDGRIEIVDGSQRIRTLTLFLDNNLRLSSLDFLDHCNDMCYEDFSRARQRKFNNTSMRMIVLSEKSDDDAKFLLFERINTGSDTLNPMETRRGLHSGGFVNFLTKCANLPLFNELTRFTEISIKRKEREELILRFFAFSEEYDSYKGNLESFLTKYTKSKSLNFHRKIMFSSFLNMLKFVKIHSPTGFYKEPNSKSTPRARFEAISVGVHFALTQSPNTEPPNKDWLSTDSFNEVTTGSSLNTHSKVRKRIEYVRDILLRD